MEDDHGRNAPQNLKNALNYNSQVSCQVEWVSSFQSKKLMGPFLVEDGFWARVLGKELWPIIRNYERGIGRVGTTELTSDTGEKRFFLVLDVQHLQPDHHMKKGCIL